MSCPKINGQSFSNQTKEATLPRPIPLPNPILSFARTTMRCTTTSPSAAAALLCLLAFAAAAAAARPGASAAASSSAASLRRLQQDKQQQCFDFFALNQHGGTSGITTRVPACSHTNFKPEACCSQTKATLALGPEGCLCDAAVWSEVERQMTSSGHGLTPDSLRLFSRTCGIPNAGAGTC